MILRSVIHTAFTGRWQQSCGEWKWRVKEAGKAENMTVCSPYPILLFVCVIAVFTVFFKPSHPPLHSHVQDSIGRGSRSIAGEGWPSWWQMGDAVGRLGWDERVSGTASAPLHVTELTLLFGEHTCQEQSLVQPLPYHSWQHLKAWASPELSVPLICGGRTGLMLLPLEFHLCGSRLH